MPTQAKIDGVDCTLEKLADGSIRVTHESQQINPCHGPDVDGGVMYVVHPAQRYQHEYLTSMLPADQRPPTAMPEDSRPWWSYAGAAKEKREKAGGGE